MQLLGSARTQPAHPRRAAPEEGWEREGEGEGRGGGGEGRGGEGEGKGRGRRGDGDIQPSVLDTEPLENPSIME